MKMIVAMMLASGVVLAGPAKILPVDKAEVAARKEAEKKMKEAKIKKQDHEKKVAPCDEKAKKPVEIVPESISLSGNTGCSLDDAH